MFAIGNDVHGSEVARDDWIIDDSVLKSPKVMVKCDDVFLECDPRCKRDPAFVSFHSRRGRREPFVESFRRTHETPHRGGVRVDELVSADGSHAPKLLGQLPVDRSELVPREVVIDVRKDTRTEESSVCRKW